MAPARNGRAPCSCPAGRAGAWLPDHLACILIRESQNRQPNRQNGTASIMPDDAIASATPTTLFPLAADQTEYRRLTAEHVALDRFDGEEVLKVAPEALRLLTEQAFIDINHLL